MLPKETIARLRKEIASITAQKEAARKERLLEMERADKKWALVAPSIVEMFQELNREVLDSKGRIDRVDVGPFLDGVVLHIPEIGSLVVNKVFRPFKTPFDNAVQGEQYKRLLIGFIPESDVKAVASTSISLFKSKEEIITRLEEVIPEGLVYLYQKIKY